MKKSSRVSAVVLGTAALLAVAVPAYAAWQITATNPQAAAKATAVGPVTGVGSTVTSSTVTLTWTAPSGVAPTGYTVTRTAPTTAAVCTNAALTTCTDSGLSASTTYSYSIVALRSNWTSTAVTTNATTSAGVITRTFVVSVSGNATAGTAKSVSLTAQNNGVTDLTYTGPHTVTFSGAANSPNGTVPTASQAVTFTNGVGTATPTFYKAETFTLTVSEASPARSGSTSVTVVAGVQATLAYVTTSSGTTVACTSGSVAVGNGGTFTAFVAIQDAYGNLTAQGGSSRTITLARTPTSGGGNAPSPTSLTVNANANPAVTSASFNATLPSGSPADTTYTATSSGLSSVSCIVKKN